MFNINKPRNVGELRALYEQYGRFLTPDNRRLLEGLITEMEKGPDKANQQTLRDIAGRMKNNLNNMQNKR